MHLINVGRFSITATYHLNNFKTNMWPGLTKQVLYPYKIQLFTLFNLSKLGQILHTDKTGFLRPGHISCDYLYIIRQSKDIFNHKMRNWPCCLMMSNFLHCYVTCGLCKHPVTCNHTAYHSLSMWHCYCCKTSHIYGNFYAIKSYSFWDFSWDTQT